MEEHEMVDEQIEISQELYEELSVRAAKEGCSEEEIVVAALRWYIEEYLPKLSTAE